MMYLAALLTEAATDVASPQSTATEVRISTIYLLGRACLWHHNMIKTVKRRKQSSTHVRC
jgi:hypothetical protein